MFTKEKMIKALESGIALRKEKKKGFFQVLEHLNEWELAEIQIEIEDTENEIDYLTTVLNILKKS